MIEMGLVTLGAGLISGLAGLGSNPKEDAIKDLLTQLEDADFLKDTAFSKDELFNSIMPAIQRTQRGAADVAAGRLGAAVGEGDVAGGQAYFDYYIQSLAPVIAQGETQAAQTYKDFTQLYANMDATAKGQFLQSMQLQGNLTQGLSGMNETQQFLTNFMSGANTGATAYGNVSQGLALSDKGDLLSNLNPDVSGLSSSGSLSGLVTSVPNVNVSQGGLGGTR